MKRSAWLRLPLALTACIFVAATASPAQNSGPGAPASGMIEFVARATPTAGRAEPVRQITFYLLKKSFGDIRKEAEAAELRPDLDKFIAGLKVSTELKDWMIQKKTVNLGSPDIVPVLNAEDILKVKEFLDAYLTANAGMRAGLPRPKYREADRTKNPEKYTKQKEIYHAALRKFIEANPLTIEGTETALEPMSPQRAWAQLNAEHDRRLVYRLPELAQTRYLVAKTDTDLEGRALLSEVPAGTYWLSTLGQAVAAGDVRLRWDVEVTVKPGQTTRLELSNLNAADSQGSAP